jgi:hypothetical protein
MPDFTRHLATILKTDGQGYKLDLVRTTAPEIPTLKAGETFTATTPPP